MGGRLKQRWSFGGCGHSSTITTITAGLAREVCETCGHVSLRYVDSAVRLRPNVEPTQAERTLNGYKLKAKRQIDWQEQFQRACEAFARNGFFVLVGDKQAATLDEEFEVKVDTEVSFVKLVPLVGG